MQPAPVKPLVSIEALEAVEVRVGTRRRSSGALPSSSPRVGLHLPRSARSATRPATGARGVGLQSRSWARLRTNRRPDGR